MLSVFVWSPFGDFRAIGTDTEHKTFVSVGALHADGIQRGKRAPFVLFLAEFHPQARLRQKILSCSEHRTNTQKFQHKMQNNALSTREHQIVFQICTEAGILSAKNGFTVCPRLRFAAFYFSHCFHVLMFFIISYPQSRKRMHMDTQIHSTHAQKNVFL